MIDNCSERKNHSGDNALRTLLLCSLCEKPQRIRQTHIRTIRKIRGQQKLSTINFQFSAQLCHLSEQDLGGTWWVCCSQSVGEKLLVIEACVMV